MSFKIKCVDLDEVVIKLPDPENDEEITGFESMDIKTFLSKISEIILEFLECCSGENDKNLHSDEIITIFGKTFDLPDNFSDKELRTFFINEDIIFPLFGSFLKKPKTKDDFPGTDLYEDMSPSANVALLSSKNFDKILVRLYIDGYRYDSNQMDKRIVLLPFKKTLEKGWIFLNEKVFDFRENGDFDFQCEAGSFTFKKFSPAWKKAIFATSPEEKLFVFVKHYLLVPDEDNPLTILLRSGQPTIFIAKQARKMLEKMVLTNQS